MVAIVYDAPPPTTHCIEEPRPEISLDWPIEPRRPWLKIFGALRRAKRSTVVAGSSSRATKRPSAPAKAVPSPRRRLHDRRRANGHARHPIRLGSRRSTGQRREARRHERDHPDVRSLRRPPPSPTRLPREARGCSRETGVRSPRPCGTQTSQDEGPPSDAKHATHVAAKPGARPDSPSRIRPSPRSRVDQGRCDHEHDRRQRAPPRGLRGSAIQPKPPAFKPKAYKPPA